MSIGLELKKARKLKGMTQTEVANLLGLTVRNYQKYESNEINVPVKRFDDISRILDIRLIEIFNDTSKNNNYLDTKNIITDIPNSEDAKKDSYVNLLKKINIHEIIKLISNNIKESILSGSFSAKVDLSPFELDDVSEMYIINMLKEKGYGFVFKNDLLIIDWNEN